MMEAGDAPRLLYVILGDNIIRKIFEIRVKLGLISVKFKIYTNISIIKGLLLIFICTFATDYCRPVYSH